MLHGLVLGLASPKIIHICQQGPNRKMFMAIFAIEKWERIREALGNDTGVVDWQNFEK